jgi:hypothetical protein
MVKDDIKLFNETSSYIQSKTGIVISKDKQDMLKARVSKRVYVVITL